MTPDDKKRIEQIRDDWIIVAEGDTSFTVTFLLAKLDEAVQKGQALCEVHGNTLIKLHEAHKALKEIAVQRTPIEIEARGDDLDHQDFEGAYELMILLARKALGEE